MYSEVIQKEIDVDDIQNMFLDSGPTDLEDLTYTLCNSVVIVDALKSWEDETSMVT